MEQANQTEQAARKPSLDEIIADAQNRAGPPPRGAQMPDDGPKLEIPR